MDENVNIQNKPWFQKIFEVCPLGMALFTSDFGFARINEAFWNMRESLHKFFKFCEYFCFVFGN